MKIKTFPLRMDETLHKKLKTKAANEETSMTEIIIEALKEKITLEKEDDSSKEE